MQTAFTYFLQGGSVMWVILGISVLAGSIALERYFALRFRYYIDGRRLFNDVKKYLTANDWKRAQETCRQYSHVPLAQVLGAGLAHADQSIQEMDTAMESQTLYYVPKINERLGYLSILANVALLVGLLGTISGLIASFSAVGGMQSATTGHGEALAGGISIAMYTTAFGLIVAIPTLLIHMFLANHANRLIDDIDHYATSLKQLIQKLQKQGKVANTENQIAVSNSQQLDSNQADQQQASNQVPAEQGA